VCPCLRLSGRHGTAIARDARVALRVRITFGILFGLAIVFAACVVWPFRGPLFLALVLASVLHGVHSWIVRRVGGRRIAGAALTTFGLLVVIIGPVAAAVGFVAGQIVNGLGFVRDQLGVRMVDRALGIFHLSPAQIQDVVLYASSAAEKAAQRALEGSPRVAFHTALLLIAFYFFLLEGPRILRWMERISPLDPRQTEDLIAEFRSVSRASILGAALAALFQGVAATVGFLLVGVPNPVFFGALTMAASFVPVVGTLVVWLPAVAFLWLFGHHTSSMALLAWCLLLIVGAEHAGKPFLLRALRRGGETMHTGLVFLSLLGGIEMFGPIGLVLGPLLIAWFLAMVRIYERDFFSSGGGDRIVVDGDESLRERAPMERRRRLQRDPGL
jgi:predicted PurR-regulated permease PerM